MFCIAVLGRRLLAEPLGVREGVSRDLPRMSRSMRA